jgi:O-antigen/teichoic acid export membrane protein
VAAAGAAEGEPTGIVSSHLRRIAGQSGWLLGGQLAQGALALVQAIVLTRALGVRGYGLFVLVMVSVTAVVQLLDSRVWEALTRYVPLFRARSDCDAATATLQLCILIEIASGVLAFAAVWLLAEPIASTFVKDPDGAHWLRIYAFTALFAIANEVSAALLRVSDRYVALALHGVASAALATLAVTTAWLLGGGVEAMLLARLAGAAGAALILVVLCVDACRRLGLNAARPRAFAALRGRRGEILRFALLSNVTASARLVTSHADVLLLGLLQAPAVVGIYELARRMANTVHSLSVPLYSAVFPEISKLVAEGRHAEVAALRSQLTRILFAAVVPLCGVGTLLAPLVVPLVFGGDFAASAPLLQVLLWYFLWLPLLWLPGFLLAIGRARELTTLSVADALVYLVLLLGLIPAFGAMGAAAATVLRSLLWVAAGLTLLGWIDRRGWQ